MKSACSVQVRGIVQGVGFRPFVFRLARAHTLAGWVQNGDDGVEIHVEGAGDALETFVRELSELSPPAARITAVDVSSDEPAGLDDFTIRESIHTRRPTVRVAPDMAVCPDCLAELFDVRDRRFKYPYINCTNCGPRYTIVRSLPYDRVGTTMESWPLDGPCAAEFHDSGDRRFHAQPVACPECGPGYRLIGRGEMADGREAVARAAGLLGSGAIVAIKGLGGYHLACDASNAGAVAELRDRKYRKEQPFALMACNTDTARELADFDGQALRMLESAARPIVLARARVHLPDVAPDCDELGVMLPYTPLHHLLFAEGAPRVLVMTSGNRSNEPIAYEDGDALDRLGGIADAFLVGERPIARRVDDSVVRVDAGGPMILRRARGYAPEAVAAIPSDHPVLAVGADLKNAVTLVVEGQALVSQHIGDLELEPCRRAFRETVDDLLRMYEVDVEDLVVVHDAHPGYASTQLAVDLPAREHFALQHHRAHVLSVLAERGAWEHRVLGVAFDGTGYGDDGAIWGGEIFAGSVHDGFDRVGHLRPALLPGGDAAARHPVQAAAGFLAQIDGLPDLGCAPFRFPPRYFEAMKLVERGVRTFATTSVGRLFDTAAALLGFTRPMTFEGQAAMWLEQLAGQAGARPAPCYEMPFDADELDFRPLLLAAAADRVRGVPDASIARAFHRAVAAGIVRALAGLCGLHGIETVVASGGVFQNRLLLADVRAGLAFCGLELWTNHIVPPNDGGVSLGQAAVACANRRA